MIRHKLTTKNENEEIKELSINEEIFFMKRGFKGVWIEAIIYACNELNWNEKMLWIEIDYLSTNGNEGCYASNEYFSKFLGISESAVQKYISRLKDLKLIEQVCFDGRKRFLKTNKSIFNDLHNKVIKKY